MSDGDSESYRKKFENGECELAKLRKLASRAIADYDDLKAKYDENVIAFEALRNSCIEQESQLSSIPNVLESVAAEYEEIKTKYELATDLRTEAETYASQVHKQNVKLKRQSQALFTKFNVSVVDIDIDGIGEILEEEPENVDKKDVERLNETIKGLEEQISTLRGEVLRAVSDKDVAEKVALEAKQMFEEERKANDSAKYSLEYYQKTLKQLERASVLLVEDYDQLYDQIEAQKLLQSKAEEYASKMVQDREAMKRQSSALMASAATNERLMKSMMEIENLTKQLEEAKFTHKTEMDAVRAELDNTFELEKITSLEQQLSLSTTESQTLEKRIADAEQKILELEKENRDLEEKLKNPPPPPPPPPPPIKSILPTLSAALLKKKKKATTDRVLNKAPQSDAMNDAVKEMMERIKKGTALKKRVSTGNKPIDIAKKEGTAIGEMHGILSSLKTKRTLMASPSLPGRFSAEKSDSQLLKILSTRRQKTDVTSQDKENNADASNTTQQKSQPPRPSPRKSTMKKLANVEEVKQENGNEEEAMYDEIK